jgi:hypothetical protein
VDRRFIPDYIYETMELLDGPMKRIESAEIKAIVEGGEISPRKQVSARNLQQ